MFFNNVLALRSIRNVSKGFLMSKDRDEHYSSAGGGGFSVFVDSASSLVFLVPNPWEYGGNTVKKRFTVCTWFQHLF